MLQAIASAQDRAPIPTSRRTGLRGRSCRSPFALPDWITDPPQADVSQRAGYFDQMHLVKDFKSLTDAPPSRLIPQIGLTRDDHFCPDPRDTEYVEPGVSQEGRPPCPFLTSRTPDAHAIVAAGASTPLLCPSRYPAYTRQRRQDHGGGPPRHVQFGIKRVF